MSVPAQGTQWPSEFAGAARALLKSVDFARQLQRSDWDFALEIAELHRHGLDNCDLRLLVHQGFIDHATELVETHAEGRRFQAAGMRFTPRTCFILTEPGRIAAQQLRYSDGLQTSSTPPSPRPATSSSPTSPNGSPYVAQAHVDAGSIATSKPIWDVDQGRLTFANQLVKEFKTPAPNQQLILSVFQEEECPPRIDDPLPSCPTIHSKRRLHETITALNRHQKNRLIRFRGDGRGQGVRWEPIS